MLLLLGGRGVLRSNAYTGSGSNSRIWLAREYQRGMLMLDNFALANKITDGDCGVLANTMNDLLVSVWIRCLGKIRITTCSPLRRNCRISM